MLRETWDQAQRLFLLAADMARKEQVEFLDRACDGDAELRAEIEALLLADQGSGDYIASFVESEAALLFETHMPGERLGAYRIVREIGRGGMGAVFLATPDDDQYEKKVAIKVVKRGMDTVEVLQRFRHERQILANLDHPYIGRLYDGGVTSDGRPFFVMEFIDGKPIDSFCVDADLDVKGCLRLFLKVCEAVAHAHRNLVVHRDLKPGNIFVTADQLPKLLDFGIAKLLGGEGGDKTGAMTRLFTPGYASPEQVLGLPVTTAADVYSLGAVLYELLTGQRAQQMSGATPLELDHSIVQTETKRPSQIVKSLNADLDNIVLMAMRKEPERRYSSVDQLSEDIQRYLRGEPISARQSSFAYRATKFLRRHWQEVSASALLLAVLVGATVVSLVQSHRAEIARQEAVLQSSRAEAEYRHAEIARQGEAVQRRVADQQRDEAQAQRTLAEQHLTDLLDLANRTLFDVHSAIESLPGSLAARRSIVKTTLDYLERLDKEMKAVPRRTGLVGDERLRLVLSAAYYKVGIIQGDNYTSSLQDFEGARASFVKAQTFLAPLYHARPNDVSLMLRWIKVECSLADLVLQSGQRESAAKLFLALLPLAQKLAKAASGDVTSSAQEPEIYGRLANAVHLADAGQGVEYAAREVALLRSLVVRFPSDVSSKRMLGEGLASLAGSSRAQGRLDRAASLYNESITLREQLLLTDPHNNLLRRNLIVAYGNYAVVLGVPWSPNLGKPAEARAASAKGVTLARANVAIDQQDVTARVDLALSLTFRGAIDPESGEVGESVAALRESITILDPIVKANPKFRGLAGHVATAREYLAYRLENLGKPAEAKAELQKSLEEVESLAIGGNSSAMAQVVADLEGLAALAASVGNRTTAFANANRALASAEQYAKAHNNDAANARRAHAYFTLAIVHERFGEWMDSSKAAQAALGMWKSIHNPGLLSVHQQAIEQATALLHDVRRPEF